MLSDDQSFLEPPISLYDKRQIFILSFVLEEK
jgi:hypothetical protein